MEELKCAAGLNRRRRKGKPAFLFGAELDQWDLFLWIMEVHCPPPKKKPSVLKCAAKRREEKWKQEIQREWACLFY